MATAMPTIDPVCDLADSDTVAGAQNHIATGKSAPAVFQKTTAAVTHPFFKTTSEKKSDIKQQKQLDSANATDTNLPEVHKTSKSPPKDEKQNPAKPKRSRKPRSNSRSTVAAPRTTRALKSKLTKELQVSDEPSLPVLPPPPTSSPMLLPQSVRTEIDPVTAAAPPPLTPASSPPPPPTSPPDNLPEAPQGQSQELPPEVEAEIDLNHGRRKRRRTTPPEAPSFSAYVRVEVDTETNTILSSPAAGLRRDDSDLGIVGWQSPKLTIRARGRIKPEDLLPKPKMDPPSSPALPPAPVKMASSPDKPIFPTSRGSMHSTYNKETNIFTIRSSPPAEPIKKNLFAVLGKKETPKKEASLEKKPGKKDKGPKKGIIIQDGESIKKEPIAEKRSRKKGKAHKKEQENEEIKVKDDELSHADSLKQDTQIGPVPQTVVPIKSQPQPQPQPAKSHPFFNPAQRKKMQQSAPVEPEVQALPDGSKPSSLNTEPKLMKSVNNSGFGSTFGRIGGSGLSSFSTRISKIPGMLEAPWPVKGTSHIRGITIETKRTEGAPVSTERKLKNSLISISADESVFGILRKKLGLGELKKNISSHDYAEREYRNVPPEVRVPERVVLTGSQLQEMIRTRVNTRLPHPNAVKEENDGLESDSESDMALNRTQVHPMLRRLYERLRTELTPFDEHKCETTPWETKYAPMKTEEVLQSGRELSVFAAWLTELKTDKLDIPTSKSGKRKAKREGSGPKGGAKKKRKKKRVVEDDGLGGFVINSEEEEDLMDEISDPEEEDWTNQNDKVKKSTIRSGDKFNNLDELFATPKDSKKTNAVLISGPTGCGKTAAVYAVAKELGYVVFEISPGTRRNGKDLLDQVGDMSRNHLVHQQKNQSAQQDNPFSITKAVKHKEQTLENDTQVHQQQSLILLEEVDILFEEDKTFWTSVMTLMSKSKRPIVMTCNDESLVPIDTLSLHAILRFSMPNRDLVVDKLLLVCANEGHILQRPAVDALVKTNKGDIRSSLMDLQIHCRMGVGDRTGSLGWQLIRWPIGSDIAENGERMRVVSVDTYQSGMGMIDNSQDAKVKDKWEDVWREYDIDIGSSSLGLQECAWDIQSASVSKKVSLPITDAFFEARSAADAFAGHAMLCIDEPKLDYTLPERNNISKLDDLQGISVVQTDRLVIPGSVETDMSIYMRYLARKYLSKELQKVSVKLQPISHDEIVNAVIRRNETDWLSRMDYQALFTPLSKLEAVFASTMPTAHSSIFPAMYKLAVEISPWVRFIIRNDIKLEKQRRDTGKLLSAGGKQRTTRAARLALAGGSREKKERWLRGLGANVLKSAGENWDEGVLDAEGDDDDVDMLSPDSSC